MPVPIVYRAADNVNASYDWLDVTSGVGYRRYFGVASDIAAGAEYFLTPESVTSYEEGKSANGTASPAIDLDFDITFNKPAYVKGVAVVNALFRSVSSASITPVVNIYHVTAVGTETLLGTATMVNRSVTGYYKQTIRISLTEKQFIVGDRLRLNMQLNILNGNQGWIYFDSGTSVTDVDGRTVTGTLAFDCPFRIDL